MKSLMWKQWRENRLYLAIFIAWMLLAVCYTVGYELGYRFRAAVGSFSGMAMLYSTCAAMFLAMRTAQGEQADGSIAFSASLPVSLRRIAAVRIGAAVVTLAIPILLAAFMLALALASGLIEQATPRGIPYQMRLPQRETAAVATSLEQLGSVAMIASFGGIQLLLILSLCGCWLRSQAQVGFWGAVLALGIMVAEGLLWHGGRPPISQLIYGALLPQSLVVHSGYEAEVGGYTDHELVQYRWVSLALASIQLLAIGYFFTTQYGRLRQPAPTNIPGRFRFLLPAIWSNLPIHLPGRLVAMIWLELRQSLPLAICGLLFAVLLTIAGELMQPARESSFSTSEFVRMNLPHTVFYVGMLWAVVVGAGIYSADLSENLGAFWRSRPISQVMWFWCKFFVGLVVVLAVLDGCTILVAWNAPRETPHDGISWAYVACFPILHAWMYALAVLWTCWLRKPVIGGFLAVLSYTLLSVAMTTFPATNWLEPINVYYSMFIDERGLTDLQENIAPNAYPIIFGTLTASVVGFAILSARLAKSLQPPHRW